MAVVLICLVNGFIGTFVLYQCNNMFILLREVRKYKSCGVFISLVLIFEQCYFVNDCGLSGKIRPDMSTKIFLNDNSHNYNLPHSFSSYREIGWRDLQMAINVVDAEIDRPHIVQYVSRAFDVPQDQVNTAEPAPLDVIMRRLQKSTVHRIGKLNSSELT